MNQNTQTPLQTSPGADLWLQLANASGVGPVIFSRLLSFFGSVENAMGASVSELTKVDGIGIKTAEAIARTRRSFNAEVELELAAKLGVAVITMQDVAYPAALKQIHDPPPVLYIKGTLARSDALAIAIVGSRRCSNYGQEQSSRFAHLLASAGFCIISGMARGIDSAAHRGALTAKGRTLAIQGAGLAKVFPPENRELFEEISRTGACISELPLNSDPLPENFPARNRIIAGLSLGVLVIESSINSGALITAKSALEINREVMAIPGKIDSPLSAGSHKLIKEGAKLVDSIDDIMEALGYIGDSIGPHAAASADKAAQQAEAPLFDTASLGLTPDEKTVHDRLSRDPVHIEELIAETALPVGTISSALISLRLKGLIKDLPGNSYIRK
jgi:DNA processing protein